jgi:hypothetical protein
LKHGKEHCLTFADEARGDGNMPALSTLFLQGFFGGERKKKMEPRIAWMQGRKPSAELAVFYCKVACAIEDNLDRYHYHDKGLTPPKRS